MTAKAKLVCLISLFVFIQFGQIGWAQSTTTTDDPAFRFQDYEARINAILRTRLPEEKAFVTQVMDLVRTGKLPEKVVETSYKWAVEKHPYTNYPFIYFERVLRIQTVPCCRGSSR